CGPLSASPAYNSAIASHRGGHGDGSAPSRAGSRHVSHTIPMRRPGPLCQVLKMPVAVAAVRPRWLVAVVLLLGGGAIGAYFVLGKGASAKAPTTKAAPLVELVNSKVVDLPHIVEAQGHVVPLNEVEVRAQMEGAVASL